jgi:hypothetical protein
MAKRRVSGCDWEEGRYRFEMSREEGAGYCYESGLE